jgi:hypothetical protein
MRRPSFLLLAGLTTLFYGQAAASDNNGSALDRFGGPLNAGDVFPTTMEPLHPLNPADLSRSSESIIQFGIQPDGRSLILGLPNFLLAISDQDIDWARPSGTMDSFHAKKYEVGYGLSTEDLSLTPIGGPAAAIGFNLRYLDFQSDIPGGYNKAPDQAQRAYGDMGVSGWYRRFRADAAILNAVDFGGNGGNGADTLPGRLPREYSLGLAYGVPSDWLISARLGIQDTSKGESIVDVGGEKLFFGNVTFRIGSQRRYGFGQGDATKEVKSSLSGGLWYRLTSVGRGYRYPDRDGELFSGGTLLRILRNVEVGGVVVQTSTPGADGVESRSDTSLLLTVGKAF